VDRKRRRGDAISTRILRMTSISDAETRRPL